MHGAKSDSFFGSFAKKRGMPNALDSLIGASNGAVTGAVAGGIYGAASDDESILSGAFKGAIAGGGIGFMKGGGRRASGAGKRFIQNNIQARRMRRHSVMDNARHSVRNAGNKKTATVMNIQESINKTTNVSQSNKELDNMRKMYSRKETAQIKKVINTEKQRIDDGGKVFRKTRLRKNRKS